MTWDEALAAAAAGLRRALREGGPDAVGVLASARQTNEENYLTQKFARLVIGTNSVDCCARVCHAPTATALNLAFGSVCRPTASTISSTPPRFSSSARTPQKTIPSSVRASNRPRDAEARRSS